MEQISGYTSVVELDEGLMPLFKRRRSLRERELVIIQAPLNVKVGLYEILPALPGTTGNRPMVERQPLADGFKGVGRVGATPYG